MNHRWLVRTATVLAAFFVAGCALKARTSDIDTAVSPAWHGRLVMQVQAHPDEPLSQPRSFGAAFELLGTPDLGELNFFTPLGNTAATIRWTPRIATLDAQGETKTFESLSHLIGHLLGTNVPVSALFAWLKGRDLPADGWEVDLRQFTQGKIVAERLAPLPKAQLRVILEP